ncbi:cyclic pyranopterin monophosphate synthase MoaC [Actinomadura graeca]|uniref:Cyclic pyranopterin monophosphate synthase n=1 Tax=Actinomadura graeca TaxID=2750812 RepID=A0ABX8QU84_9ACTN|nr:cyclic pyranopterin monophosphate synthase MoaC [Actinomadura graeca]QXJ22306.1 cyclic pyranopterin monophosphate synthase MoaC [Actinomadura graeca]
MLDEAGPLTHLDQAGNARMVDVAQKEITSREATASGTVVMSPATLAAISSGATPKGDVFSVARIAGIMAAKRTHELIPLCHPLALDAVSVVIVANPPDRVLITARVGVTARTGVEMEALTAVSVAALTVYDMCKALDRSMRIERIRLDEKSGGRSGHYRRD